jgi:hypothetical protein
MADIAQPAPACNSNEDSESGASWNAIAAAAWDAPSWKAAAIEYRADHPAKIPSTEPEAPRHPAWYCETCNSRPCVNSSFCRACRAADNRAPPLSERTKRLRRLMDDNVSAERAWHEITTLSAQEAARVTVDALVYQLRRSADALREPSALRRLARLSEAQVREVGERVRKFKPDIAPAWGLDAIEALLKIWIIHHG